MAYAELCGFMGEIISQQGDVSVWEVRQDIKRYSSTNFGSTGVQVSDQPPLHEIARFFEEFWTSGEPLPADNGLYINRRVEVLEMTLDPERVRVTLRPLPLR